MCYALILSTTSNEDLSRFNCDAVKFNADVPERLPVQRLNHPNKWYVGSRTTCSCSFRHLAGPDFDFGVPEDWFPEDPANIEATLIFVRVVRDLLAKGERVDCINAWESNLDETPRPMTVDLGQVRDEEFRLFENYHFELMING